MHRYVWSMISAVGSFFLGAGASVYHGVHVCCTTIYSCFCQTFQRCCHRFNVFVYMYPKTLYHVYVPHALPPPLLGAYEFITSSNASEVSSQLGSAMIVHADSVATSAPITLGVLGFAGILER
jgi:TRAP-type mannitol/chloroaromatic compound transport system permease small subunit